MIFGTKDKIKYHIGICRKLAFDYNYEKLEYCTMHTQTLKQILNDLVENDLNPALKCI